jgi:hypothetical protein
MITNGLWRSGGPGSASFGVLCTGNALQHRCFPRHGTGHDAQPAIGFEHHRMHRVGKLRAIAVIRTAINFFLGK